MAQAPKFNPKDAAVYVTIKPRDKGAACLTLYHVPVKDIRSVLERLQQERWASIVAERAVQVAPVPAQS